MVVAVTKVENETNEHLMQRFKKAVRGARLLVQLKRNKYHTQKPTKRKVRASALMREKYRKKRKEEQYQI